MKKMLLDNLGLKITAVFLSILLWIFVTSRGQSEMSLDVPLEFRGIPQGLEIVSQSVKVISLNMRGQERLLKNVKPSDIIVSLDLSKAKPGDSTYYIHREDIQLPNAITVTNINPSNVKVVTEETVRKAVRVIPMVTGEPERGFSVKSVSVVPASIEIEGSRREVSRMNTVRTEPLDVTGMNETFAQDLKLDLTGRMVRTKTTAVSVQVMIESGGRRK
jgi:YbbR domain-containing protein